MMRQFLSNYFSKHYDVKTASSAAEAWAWLDEGQFPALIVLDLRMPDASGLDVLTQLKCSAMFSDIPVIMLSSVDNSAERLKCLQTGAVDYIIKPFNPKELEHRINLHIRLCKVS